MCRRPAHRNSRANPPPPSPGSRSSCSGLAQLQHATLVEVGLWLNGAKYELITAAALPMSPIRGRARNTNTCTTSLNERVGGFERLLDALHGGARSALRGRWAWIAGSVRACADGHDTTGTARVVPASQRILPAAGELIGRRERHDTRCGRSSDDGSPPSCRGVCALAVRGRERRRGDREPTAYVRNVTPMRGGRADHHGRISRAEWSTDACGS